MHVGIDGDVLRYELGAVAQKKEKVFDKEFFIPWPDKQVRDLVNNRINQIVDRTGATDYTIYLSGGENFRHGIATIVPYKGNRVSAKPYHWSTIGNHLRQEFGAIEIWGAEADDILSLHGRSDPDQYIIASRDKDLRITPCYHYSWRCGESQPEIPVHRVEVLGKISSVRSPSGGYSLKGEGLKFFYGQVLVGDAIDNYKGCKGCGPAKAAALLVGAETEEELYERTLGEYQRAYGPDEALWRLKENARLAWLLDQATIEELPENKLYVSPITLWEPPTSVSTVRA